MNSMPPVSHPIKQRDAGVEVWRCLLMFLILLHHCCQNQLVTTSPGGYLTSIPTYFAVDGFVAIAGLYGIRFSWKKWLNIYGQAIFWCVIGYVLAKILFCQGGVPFPLKFSVGGTWFLPAYLALMAIAPLINAGVEAFKNEGHAKLWCIWGAIALAFWFSWIGSYGLLKWTNFNVKGWSGHAFSTLFFVYLTMRVLMSTDYTRIKTRWFALGGIAAFAMLIASSVYFFLFREPKPGEILQMISPLVSFGYNAPWVIVTAVCFTALFKRWDPPAWLAGLGRFAGPSMWSVCVLHTTPLFYLYTIQRPIENLLAHECHPAVICLLAAILCFCAATVLDIVLRRGGLYVFHRVYARLTILRVR